MGRTKVVDEIHRYRGVTLLPAHCRVRIYRADGRTPVVVVSECDDNAGASITNCAETLYPGVIAKYLPGWLDQADALTLVEHYPGVEGRGGRRDRDTFDLVTFDSWATAHPMASGRPVRHLRSASLDALRA